MDVLDDKLRFTFVFDKEPLDLRHGKGFWRYELAEFFGKGLVAEESFVEHLGLEFRREVEFEAVVYSARS